MPGRDVFGDRTQGAVTEAKRVLRLQGDEAFGPPDARTAGVIALLNDLERLEEVLRRVRTVASWQELLGPSGGQRRGRRRQAP
jgi:hypothetical protein